MSRSVFQLLIIGALASLVTQACKRAPSPDDRLPIRVSTFKSGNGWGYDVYVDDSLFIHQPFVPAVNGNQIFVTQQEAQRVGDLVMKKIAAGTQPMLSSREVDSVRRLK